MLEQAIIPLRRGFPSLISNPDVVKLMSWQAVQKEDKPRGHPHYTRYISDPRPYLKELIDIIETRLKAQAYSLIVTKLLELIYP